MTGLHSRETAPMIDAYDFSPFQTVVDIGGGNGQVLAAILNHHTALHGVLFDMPDVVERARSNIISAGLSDRCQIVGGDFFVSVPAGGDAYVMRHILMIGMMTRRFRRLVRDYEQLAQTLRGLHVVAFTMLMLSQLMMFIFQSA